MATPPGHAAGIGAEELCLTVGMLRKRSAALFTIASDVNIRLRPCFNDRSSAQIGFDRVYGEPQLFCYPCSAKALSAQFADMFFLSLGVSIIKSISCSVIL